MQVLKLKGRRLSRLFGGPWSATNKVISVVNMVTSMGAHGTGLVTGPESLSGVLQLPNRPHPGSPCLSWRCCRRWPQNMHGLSQGPAGRRDALILTTGLCAKCVSTTRFQRPADRTMLLKLPE